MVFVLIALGGLVAFILLALILVPMFIDETALIAMAQEAVRDETGGELIVAGDSELSLFPRLAVELNDTQLILPARTEYEQAIDAKLRKLSLGLSILPTLRGTPEFGELRVDGLHAKITAPQALPPTPEPLPDMSDRDWERLGRTLRSEREAQRQKLLTPTNTSVAVAIAADNLTITDITLELLNARGQLENKLLLERLTVRDINTRNEPVRIDTAATVQSGESGAPIQFDMTGVVRVPSDLSQISIDRLETVIAGALAEPVKATLNGKLTLSPLDFKGRLDAALPGGDVQGDLRYAALESPQINVRLETERLDLDRMQPAGADGANSGASAPSANTGAGTRTATTPLPPVPLPVGPLKLLDLALEMNAGELTTAGQTIGNAQLSMRVRDAIADIKYLRGTLHEGQLDTRATLNTRRLQAELAVEGGMKGINLDSLMSSLGTPGAVSGTRRHDVGCGKSRRHRRSPQTRPGR
jgi:AsmA protein